MNLFRSHKLIGVVFIALIAGGVWLTGAVFTKKFTDYDEVTLQSSNVGLQMPSRADVKIRGVIVGEVLDFKATGDGAELTLGLYPDEVDTIPKNVTARIEPKTLFGEKYVALKVPPTPDPEHIEAGDTITQTELAAEIEQAINDLYPLLRTVQPADLNKTLTALATALEGRGEALGQHLEILDGYLKRINPQLPEIVEDLRLTADMSELYADVLPDIATTLRNSVKTGNTIRGREARLLQLYRDVARFSEVTGDFLDDNESNLIRVNELGAAQLRVFGKYAPEFPCLTEGIVNAGIRQAEAFRGFTLHINLEVVENQPRHYTARDRPRYGARNGPYCGQLPEPNYSQSNPQRFLPDFDDGIDEPTGKGTSRAATGFAELVSSPGSTAEADLVRSLLSVQTGRDSAEVSDLSVLLFAPLVRGMEVSLR